MNTNSGMNNEMLYSMLLDSIQKMNDAEMQSALEKAKGMLSASDYEKLAQIVARERGK